MTKLFLLFICLCCRQAGLHAQSFSINTDGSVAHNSALLDVKSTDKGILIPRMTKVQRNAIATPATGLLVFQNAPDSMGFYYYNGSIWLWLATAANTAGWLTTGNAGTDTAVNFIGTTTNMPLRFKLNNNWAGQFDYTQGNYYIGGNTGKNNTSGIVNTGMGSFALAANTTGSFNSVFGGGALSQNISGNQNTAVGTSALALHKTGNDNVSVGSLAMWQDTAGANNVSVGAFSLFSTRHSNNNTAVGASTLSSFKTGSLNTALGYSAMFSDTIGSENVAIGANALFNSPASSYNTAVGASSLRLTGLGSTNIFEGNYNTALGYQSALNIRKGFGNVAIGNSALSADTSGIFNIAVGNSAMGGYTTGTNNIGIGSSVMLNAKGSNKIAVGTQALTNDTTATGNTAVGHYAMFVNKRGINNTAIGYAAMYANFSGSRNAAFGDSALYSNNFPVASGNHFTNNTAIGFKALYNTDGFTSTNGINNTAVGTETLLTNISGTDNTALGYQSNTFFNNLINATAIGARARVDTSNAMVLGSVDNINGATETVNVGIGTTKPRARLHVTAPFAMTNTPPLHPSTRVLLESNTVLFLQLSSGNNNINGIKSANDDTDTRSGITFTGDSAIQFSAGGTLSRMAIIKNGFVGVRQTAPLSFHDVNGSTGNAIAVSQFSQTLDEFDHTAIISPTLAAVILTLPAATTCARREYVIVNQDNSTHNTSISYLDFTGAAVTAIAPNGSITIQSNGTSWFRIK